MAKQDDGLFLLEVLIDKIVFTKSPCFTDKDFRTCVNIDCPVVEPLEICDDDPGVCAAKSGGPFVKSFNNGKSCLFSLKESDISKSMSKFPVKIMVYKSLPCGCIPTKIILGEATIDMTKEFVQARKKFLEDPTNVSYQALKDSFHLIGTDGAEAGEIVMFLRISCFGKLIITRFQGGGPPSLGAGAGSSIVDRSCNPQRAFQTAENPCVCGAARGAPVGTGVSQAAGQLCTGSSGPGVCPPARDPYNSMPCEDPDDPCYCTGPKSQKKQQMACRNIDQYCLHVPKGILPNLPLYQELTKENEKKIIKTGEAMKQIYMDALDTGRCPKKIGDILNMAAGNSKVPQYIRDSDCGFAIQYSFTSLRSLTPKRQNTSPTTQLRSIPKQYVSFYKDVGNFDSKRIVSDCKIFGEKETTVYMTLYDDICSHRTSGTQATASLNKCLQVSYKNPSSTFCTDSNADSVYTMSTYPDNKQVIPAYAISSYRDSRKIIPENHRNSKPYVWGKRKEDQYRLGMGSSRRSKDLTESASIQAQTGSSSTAVQTKKPGGECASTCTAKSVSIKEDYLCPAMGAVKGDMMATVSHIRIGPKDQCPIYGKEPCQGPKCILAASAPDSAPVKVSTVSNPRRGVFELVIRKLTGAPLAKNELMLEWTPPPSRPLCGAPCSMPCGTPSSCRLSKCKTIVCRPSRYKTKCCRRGCKRPCGPVACRPVPCKKCCNISCSRKPCRPCPARPCQPCPPHTCNHPCKPCSPCRPCRPWPCRPLPPWIFRTCPPTPCKPYRPCQPCKPSKTCLPSSCRRCKSSCRYCQSPCQPCVPCPSSPCDPPCGPWPPIPCPNSACSLKPCCVNPCGIPCKSSPCLRSCPVRRKRPRKTRSQPKIKAHRKHISPCHNRSKNCTAVRCRSMPGHCLAGCKILPCPPSKYCLLPCKPLKCCRSSC